MRRLAFHASFVLAFIGLGVLLLDALAYPHGAFGLACLLVGLAIDYWRTW